MKNQSIPRGTGPQKASTASKALKRAIDKIDRKERPTIGKPVIEDPTPEAKGKEHG